MGMWGALEGRLLVHGYICAPTPRLRMPLQGNAGTSSRARNKGLLRCCHSRHWHNPKPGGYN